MRSRDRHRASFETAAWRLPQDEVFLNALKEVPHPEEVRSTVSKDAGWSCSPPFANSFTHSQDEGFFLNAINKPPYAEERPQGASRRTHNLDAALRFSAVANTFTRSFAGMTPTAPVVRETGAMWEVWSIRQVPGSEFE